MFYISSKSNDGLLGVTDSKDDVEEYHSPMILKILLQVQNRYMGFVSSSSAFEDSFVVDINKFLTIIKNCTNLYREVGTGKILTIPTAKVISFKEEVVMG